MIVKIFEDSRGRSRRRSCHAPIEWAETESGKKMPFDYPIQPLPSDGRFPLKLEGRVLLEVNTDVSRSHFATCPDAKHWRRNNGRRA